MTRLLVRIALVASALVVAALFIAVFGGLSLLALLQMAAGIG